MKNSILIITTFFLLLFGTKKLQAQNFNTEQNNYVVLSKNIKQLQPIILTAIDLAKKDGEKYGDFQVIICGKTVTDIENNNDFYKLLEEAHKQDIKVFVCGISLNKFNIAKSQMPKHIEVTKNGILYGFQLAKKGFFTLTI